MSHPQRNGKFWIPTTDPYLFPEEEHPTKEADSPWIIRCGTKSGDCWVRQAWKNRLGGRCTMEMAYTKRDVGKNVR